MSAVLELVPSTMTCKCAVCPLRSSSAKSGLDLERHRDVAAADERFQFPIVGKNLRDFKPAGKREAAQKVTAFLAMVKVNHRDLDPVHLECGGIAVDEHLDDRRNRPIETARTCRALAGGTP